MKAVSSAVMGVALLVLAPMPAFAHHKPNHPNFIGRAERAERAGRAEARRVNPCAAVSNNPHENGARQGMQQRCRRLHAQLERDPENAELRAECDEHARHLTGGETC